MVVCTVTLRNCWPAPLGCRHRSSGLRGAAAGSAECSAALSSECGPQRDKFLPFKALLHRSGGSISETTGLSRNVRESAWDMRQSSLWHQCGVFIPTTGISRLLHRGANSNAEGTKLSRDARDWDPVLARDWWAKHVLGKTLIECRSFLMIFRRDFSVSAPLYWRSRHGFAKQMCMLSRPSEEATSFSVIV